MLFWRSWNCSVPSIDVSNYEFSMEAQKEMRTVLYFRKGLNINSKEDTQVVKKSRRPDIPVWERSSLTIDQAAVYCGVGKDKLLQDGRKDSKSQQVSK